MSEMGSTLTYQSGILWRRIQFSVKLNSSEHTASSFDEQVSFEGRGHRRYSCLLRSHTEPVRLCLGPNPNEKILKTVA
jgi:hypothetical protein